MMRVRHVIRETIREIYERSPEEALNETFIRARSRYPWQSDRAFMWVSLAGIPPDRDTYGSYKIVTREELVGRKYRIEYWDGAVSIFWLDVQHNARTYKEVSVVQ